MASQRGDFHPSSQALLDKLDELLVDCIPREIENTHGIDYTAGLDELKKVSKSVMMKCENAVIERTSQLVAESQTLKSSGEPFRILSIGCGDGTFDAKILQAVIKKHPDLKIHYTGLDIDKESCQKATKALNAMEMKNKIEIKMITMDFKDIDSVKAEIEPCDLVLAMHVFYYMKDIKKAVTDAQAIKKTNGCVFIMIATFGSCQSQLYHRFWLHEHGWTIKFSDAVEDSLDALKIEYKKELIDGEMDITECFGDGFQKPHQKFLLDFMTHTKLARYPPTITQLCVELLAAAAIGKQKQYIIPFSVAFIVC